MTKAQKRGYSRKYPTDEGVRYLLHGVPRGLWRSVKSKAKRDGVSVRTAIIQLLENYIKDAA